MLLPDSPGRDCDITVAQAQQHPSLFLAGYNPQNAARTIEHRVGQRHPPPFLIGLRQRNVCVGDVEHWVAGHQRSRVTVSAEAQVHEVEHRR